MEDYAGVEKRVAAVTTDPVKRLEMWQAMGLGAATMRQAAALAPKLHSKGKQESPRAEKRKKARRKVAKESRRRNRGKK